MSAVDAIVNSGLAELEARLMNDKHSSFRNIIDEKITERFRQDLMVRSNSESIATPYALSQIDKTIISEEYPEFRIDFLNKSSHGHAFAATTRILETQLCYNEFKSEYIEKILADHRVYNTFINDIGGNHTAKIPIDRKYVHSCEPKLSTYDACRKTQRLLKNVLRGQKPTDVMICRNTVQDCNVKSMFAVAIHSIYDIPLQTLVDAMSKKMILKLVGCFMFHPMILQKNKGIIPGPKADYSVDSKNNKIFFGFRGDTNFTYTHNLKNYLQYVTTSHIVSTVDHLEYVLELTNNRCGIQFFNIVRIDSDYKYDSPLKHRIPFCFNEKMLEIKYFTWNYSASTSSSVKILLKPKSYYVKESFYNDVYSFTLSLTDNRFQPAYVYEYSRSCATRAVHNAKHIESFEMPDALSLLHISNAIYLLAYVSRWETGKVNKTLIDEQTIKRNLSSMGFIERLKLKFKRSHFTMQSCLSGLLDRIASFDLLEVLVNELVNTKVVESITVRPSHFIQTLDENWFLCGNEDTNLLQRLQGDIEISKYLNITARNKKSDDTIDCQISPVEDENTPTLPAKLGAGLLLESMYTKALITPHLRFYGEIHKCSMSASQHIGRPNAGGGYCLYFSLIDSDNLTDVKEIKTKLRSMNMDFLVNTEREELIAVLDPNKNHWGHDMVFELYSRYYRTLIILHDVSDTECICRYYGSRHAYDSIVHVKYHPSHYERLDNPPNIHIPHTHPSIDKFDRSARLFSKTYHVELDSDSGNSSPIPGLDWDPYCEINNSSIALECDNKPHMTVDTLSKQADNLNDLSSILDLDFLDIPEENLNSVNKSQISVDIAQVDSPDKLSSTLDLDFLDIPKKNSNSVFALIKNTNETGIDFLNYDSNASDDIISDISEVNVDKSSVAKLAYRNINSIATDDDISSSIFDSTDAISTTTSPYNSTTSLDSIDDHIKPDPVTVTFKTLAFERDGELFGKYDNIMSKSRADIDCVKKRKKIVTFDIPNNNTIRSLIPFVKKKSVDLTHSFDTYSRSDLVTLKKMYANIVPNLAGITLDQDSTDHLIVVDTITKICKPRVYAIHKSNLKVRTFNNYTVDHLAMKVYKFKDCPWLIVKAATIDSASRDKVDFAALYKDVNLNFSDYLDKLYKFVSFNSRTQIISNHDVYRFGNKSVDLKLIDPILKFKSYVCLKDYDAYYVDYSGLCDTNYIINLKKIFNSKIYFVHRFSDVKTSDKLQVFCRFSGDIIPIRELIDFITNINVESLIVTFFNSRTFTYVHKLLKKMSFSDIDREELHIPNFYDFINLTNEINSLSDFKQRKIQYYDSIGHKYNGFNKGEAKLREIMSTYNLPFNTFLDLCAYPGGFTVALKSICPMALGYMHIYMPGFQSSLSPVIEKLNNLVIIRPNSAFNYIGDLLDDDQFRYFLNSVTINFDLIVADGCSLDGVESKNTFNLIDKQINIMKLKLNYGGNFIIKMFLKPEFLGFIKTLSQNFKTVRLIKPKASNPISSEIYCLCFERVINNCNNENLLNIQVINCFNLLIDHLRKFLAFKVDHKVVEPQIETLPLVSPAVENKLVNFRSFIHTGRVKDKHIFENLSLEHNLYNPKFELGDDSIVNIRNSMREIKEIWRVTPLIRSETYKKLYEDCRLNNGQVSNLAKSFTKNKPNNYGIYDAERKFWVLKPNGNLSYPYGFDGKKITNFKSITTGLVLVGDDLEVMNEGRLHDAVDKLDIDDYNLDVNVTFVTGVPGCGKTHHILQRAKPGDLILTSTRESASNVNDRLNGVDIPVHTVHSYLINKNVGVYDNLWIDEALMRHYGEINYAVLKSKCQNLFIIGDVAQIPYFNKVPSIYPIFFDIKEFIQPTQSLDISHRCPVDVAYLFNGYYPNGFKTTSKVLRSLTTKIISSLNDVPKLDDVKYLVFKRIDKQTLVENGYKNVSTIGENQGNQYTNVILVRLSKVLVDELYQRSEQMLVALTRHKLSFVYYTMAKDKLHDMILNVPEDGTIRDRLIGGSCDVMIKPPTIDCKLNDILRHLIDGSYGTIVTPWRYKLNEKFEKPTVYNFARLNAGTLQSLQIFYDRVLPGNSLIDYQFDQYHCQKVPIEFDYPNVVVDMSKFAPMPERKPALRPNLRTSMPYDRLPCQLDTMIGLIKRNLNVPQLEGVVDKEYFVKAVVDKFVSTYIDKNKMDLFMNMKNQKIRPNDTLMQEWLIGQPTTTVNQINVEKSIDDLKLDVYGLNNKPQLKPGLDTKTPYEYAAVQTIASQSKYHNAIFCPIFRELKHRLMSVLSPRFLMFCDLSPEEFATKLDKNFQPERLEGLHKVEIDIGKYDKSQYDLIFRIEIAIYSMLGLDDMMINAWIDGHVSTQLRDFMHGVLAFVLYQRKSGDASTFFGNTLVLMAVLAFIFDIKFGIFAGDDSILWTEDDVDRNLLCGLIFNLESKFYKYVFSYFCSKFLVNVSNKYYFIPDPLKLITKLGRHNIVNWEHLEQYRISCMDLVKDYNNYFIHDEITKAFNERYSCNEDLGYIMSTIYNLVHNKLDFQSMFFVAPGEILSKDPSLPTLD